MKPEFENILHHLGGEDMTSEGKVAYVCFVMKFVQSAVDQAYRLHPVQQSRG